MNLPGFFTHKGTEAQRHRDFKRPAGRGVEPRRSNKRSDVSLGDGAKNWEVARKLYTP